MDPNEPNLDDEGINPTNDVKGNSSSFLKDSFFENSVEDLDLDGDLKDLDDLSVNKIADDTFADLDEAISGNLDLSPPKISSKPLPTEPLTKREDNTISRKQAISMGLEDDPAVEKYKNLFDEMSTQDGTDLKIQVSRLEPQMVKGLKISGYLESFYLPTTVADVIEKIAFKYGGGKYQLKIVDSAGRYVRSKVFEVGGLPKIPDPEQEPKEQPTQVGAAVVQTPTNGTSTSSSSNSTKLDDDDIDDDDYIEEDDDDSEDFSNSSWRKPPLQPMNPWNNSGWGGAPGFTPGGFNRPPSSSEDLEKLKREFEAKLDSKLDRVTGVINGVAAQVQQNNAPKKDGSLFTPDVLKALLPIASAYLESRSAKDNVLAQQFDAMNQRIVSLFEGVRDMNRTSDKSKEELLEKERREREQARKESFEQQQKMEQRMQDMMRQLQDTAVEKRLEYEKVREEARLREEALREETRRREEEFRERIRQEEMRWRDEIRQRDEEARKQENKWREELRQRELEAERQARARELEIMERIRSMEAQKFQTEQKMLEQSYSNKIGSKDQQLELQLQVAKLNNDNEMRLHQLTSQLELEKIKHQTQLSMAKLKSEVEASEKRPNEGDVLETALANFMKKKTQVMMIKELNLEDDETEGGDQQSPSIKNLLAGLINHGANALNPMLSQLLNGGQQQAGSAQGRVVNPTPVQTPPAPQQPSPPQQPSTTTTNQSSTPVSPTVEKKPEVVQAEVMDEDEGEVEEYEEEEVISAEVLQEQVPKIAALFEHLKLSIESNSDPQASAKFAKDTLAAPIVDYLKSLEDSKFIIDELSPILNSYNPEFVPFFSSDSSREWLNKMLVCLRKD